MAIEVKTTILDCKTFGDHCQIHYNSRRGGIVKLTSDVVVPARYFMVELEARWVLG